MPEAEKFVRTGQVIRDGVFRTNNRNVIGDIGPIRKKIIAGLQYEPNRVGGPREDDCISTAPDPQKLRKVTGAAETDPIEINGGAGRELPGAAAPFHVPVVTGNGRRDSIKHQPAVPPKVS